MDAQSATRRLTNTILEAPSQLMRAKKFNMSKDSEMAEKATSTKEEKLRVQRELMKQRRLTVNKIKEVMGDTNISSQAQSLRVGKLLDNFGKLGGNE